VEISLRTTYACLCYSLEESTCSHFWETYKILENFTRQLEPNHNSDEGSGKYKTHRKELCMSWFLTTLAQFNHIYINRLDDRWSVLIRLEDFTNSHLNLTK
jgi:hypothetical protein